MPPIVVIVFFLFIVLVIVGAVLGHRAAKRRREELAALARRLGLRFDPTERDGRPYWGEPFELFRRNNPYETQNHLRGTWHDMPADVFDYTYYSESTDSDGNTSRHYSTRTVVALELPQAYPGLVIKPDTAFREFFEFIAGADIDFESDEFNKRFYVWAGDRKFAYAVVTAPMMEFLLRARAAARDLTIQIVGHRAIFFRERTLRAPGVRYLLQFAADFLHKIPDYVKKHYARRKSTVSQS